MIVKDLIKELQKFNENAPVMIEVQKQFEIYGQIVGVESKKMSDDDNKTFIECPVLHKD